MSLKKIATIAAACAIALSAAAAQAVAIVPKAPELAAKSWILMDSNTGKVLAEHNADERIEPASITKIMTSYVLSHELAEGRFRKEDRVQITRNSWAQNRKFSDSSLMWVEPGKDVTLEQLHKGMVIASGNDASVAIAEHVAGSESSFAELMNQHAQMLGMENSNFVNAHGLPNRNHYTTARDVALMSKATLKYPETYAYYKEPSFTYNNIRQVNRNGLIHRDSSVDGLKTGYTYRAGYCLATSAKKDDMRLIAVVMGAKSTKSREQETQRLLSYGFRFFETAKLQEATDDYALVKVLKGQADHLVLGVLEDVYHTMPRSLENEVEISTVVDKYLVAPIEQGKQYGEMVVTIAGEEVKRIPLVAMSDVDKAGIFKSILHSIWKLFLDIVSVAKNMTSYVLFDMVSV